jgi:hypothetical protein
VTIGDATHCPVSGALFEVTKDSPEIKDMGHTLYFCCGACVEYFRNHRAEVRERRGYPS